MEIVEKLNQDINAALLDPKIKARLAAFGGTALALSPIEIGKLVAAETEKWGKVIRAASLRQERTLYGSERQDLLTSCV